MGQFLPSAGQGVPASGPRRWRLGAGLLGAAVASVLMAGLVLVWSAGPAAAACPPGVGDGLDAPVPVFPGGGVAGGVLPVPERPPAGDPFVAGSGVTVLEVYGVGWARWSTYDLGCGGGARDPVASADTWVGNVGLGVVKVLVAVTAAVSELAYVPGSWLGRLDPALVAVSAGLQDAITTPLGPLLVILAGSSLVWASRRLRLARAAGVGLGVVAALTVVFFTAGAPVAAGGAADSFMTSAAAEVNAEVGGVGGAGAVGPGAVVAGPFVDRVLYQRWLSGLLGSASSPVAVRYGPVLFRAQAVSWAEAGRVRGDPGATRELIAAKQAAWEGAAAKVEDEDPDAYVYLQGRRATRGFEGGWAAVAAGYPLAFLVCVFALMITGYLFVRFVVVTAPAWAVVAVLPARQRWLRTAATSVVVSVWWTLLSAVVVSVEVLAVGYLRGPGSGVDVLGTLLLLVFTAVLWRALKPLSGVVSLVTGRPPADLLAVPGRVVRRLTGAGEGDGGGEDGGGDGEGGGRESAGAGGSGGGSGSSGGGGPVGPGRGGGGPDGGRGGPAGPRGGGDGPCGDPGPDGGGPGAGPPDLPEPGTWIRVEESMSERSAVYQEQISGRPAGWAYEVAGVGFDGYTDGVLLEAKGLGYASFIKDGKFLPFFKAGRRMAWQAQQQSRAAAGRPLVWSVAEPVTVDAIEYFLEDKEISGITIMHVEMKDDSRR